MSFQFGIGGSFSGSCYIINDYGTFGLMGGSGEITLVGAPSSFVGFGALIDVIYLNNAITGSDLNFLSISAQYLTEIYIPIKSFVIRPQAAIGIGGAAHWGYNIATAGSICAIATLGCYLDYRISKNFAIYFGSSMKASIHSGGKTAYNINLTPSFSTGIKIIRQ